MTELFMGARNLSFDHFLRVLAVGMAVFSPVSILVWAAAEKLLSAAEGPDASQRGSDRRRRWAAE